MRNLITICAAFLMSFSASYANKTVDLRLSQSEFNAAENSLFVAVELRYNERGSMVLAGQNYRLFYNAGMLHLDGERSTVNLPTQEYSNLKIVENVEGIDAARIGQLGFDDNLGYVNFSIDLLNNLEGGIMIHGGEDSWVKVATLKFDVVDMKEALEIVWGRDGRSDGYATAFVEVSEWIESYTTRAIDVNEYEDLAVDMTKNVSSDFVQITVGPNPTSNYVNIALSSPVSKKTSVSVRDISGKIVIHQTIQTGMDGLRMDVSELAAANYILEIDHAESGQLFNEKIVVAK